MSSYFRSGTGLNVRPRQVPVPVISRVTEVPNSVHNQTQEIRSILRTRLHSNDMTSVLDATQSI